MQNKQLVMAYVVYMIIGSEFRSCSFNNPIIKDRLRLEYAETKANDQMHYEENIINILSELNIPEDSDATLHYYKQNNTVIMDFVSKEGVLSAFIEANGTFKIVPFKKSHIQNAVV